MTEPRSVYYVSLDKESIGLSSSLFRQSHYLNRETIEEKRDKSRRTYMKNLVFLYRYDYDHASSYIYYSEFERHPISKYYFVKGLDIFHFIGFDKFADEIRKDFESYMIENKTKETSVQRDVTEGQDIQQSTTTAGGLEGRVLGSTGDGANIQQPSATAGHYIVGDLRNLTEEMYGRGVDLNARAAELEEPSISATRRSQHISAFYDYTVDNQTPTINISPPIT